MNDKSKEYFPLFYKLDDSYRYLLWFDSDEPAEVVVLDDGTVPSFSSLEALEDFARGFTDELDENLPILHDLDVVQDWLNDRNIEDIDYSEFLAAWNAFGDVARSLGVRGEEFCALDRANFDAYDKLFASRYKRKWADEMLDGLGRVLETGLNLFRSSVIEYSSRA